MKETAAVHTYISLSVKSVLHMYRIEGVGAKAGKPDA